MKNKKSNRLIILGSNSFIAKSIIKKISKKNCNY